MANTFILSTKPYIIDNYIQQPNIISRVEFYSKNTRSKVQFLSHVTCKLKKISDLKSVFIK